MNILMYFNITDLLIALLLYIGMSLVLFLEFDKTYEFKITHYFWTRICFKLLLIFRKSSQWGRGHYGSTKNKTYIG
jgi:hypothetical protein